MKIPGFESKDKLRESDESVIYRVKAKAGRPGVILKALRGDPPSPQQLTRFRREFDLTREVQSPHVIAVHDLLSFDGTSVAILEDFGGESLDTLIQQGRPTLREALRIAVNVCQGLVAIHNAAVVHRNICPANILWNRTTGVAKIIDFGIASRVENTTIPPSAPRSLEGTLLYMSPEQTGRMNRSVDYRTDLYSLGVTLYEIFAGRRPFDSPDPLAIIHGHIAKVPEAPASLEAALPVAVSDLILRLMQKNADDRYQSAESVGEDLAECVQRLDDQGLVEPFPLARKDSRKRFRLPGKLYGRDGEVTHLVNAFEGVIAGELVFTMVGGYSGVGKSSLVQELYRPLALARGRYVAGKYDQYQRSVPYSALGAAFNGFCDQLLCEAPEELADWRQRILAAVGRNGQALIDVIAHLEWVIGPQPPLPDRDPLTAQNLFNELCQNFVQAICRPQAPIVLFLDDLQWADIASLDLIRTVLKNAKIRGLHLVGAYRDNEVGASHPLLLLLDEVDKSGRTVATLHLDNLSLASVTSLVADALTTDEHEVSDLARLIHSKTLGNAFFTAEFLKFLNADGLLRFDQDKRRWQWDTHKIHRHQVSANVVDLMAGRIRLLPVETQAALQLAACIGGLFDLKTLSIVSGKVENSDEILATLAPAMLSGLIIPFDAIRSDRSATTDDAKKGRYKFQHDRVQQAAYSLIADGDLPSVHLGIARHLIKETCDQGELERRSFEIVGHLEIGATLLIDRDEKLVAARLTCHAGLRARKASAHHASLEYFEAARKFLPQDAFDSHYALAFEIHLELAKSCSVAGRFQESEALYPLLLGFAGTEMDMVRVYTVQMDDYHLQGAYERAIEVQRGALKLLGELVPTRSALENGVIDDELRLCTEHLGPRSIADLADAPGIDSPEIIAKLKILMSLWISAYLVSQNDLVQWSSVRLTNLSLRHGNSELAAFAYVQYGYLCVARLDRYEEGYEYGDVALKLADRYGNLEMRGKVYFLFGLLIGPWTQHVSIGTEAMRKGYLFSIEAGDWTYAVYAAANVISNLIIAGIPCEEIRSEAERYLDFLQDKATVGLNSFFLPGGHCALLNLQGRTKSADSFDCEFLNEEQFHRDFGHLPIVEAWFYAVKIRSLYLHRCFEAGATVIAKAEVVAEGVPGQVKVPEAYFYSCLMVAASHEALGDAASRSACWALFLKYEAQIKSWADHCPANYLHKHCLIVAERMRVEGGAPFDVLGWYDRAIKSAQEHQFPNIVALAQELKGRYWLAQKCAGYGKSDLKEAYFGYQRWGASTKLALLEAEFDGLSGDTASQRSASYTSAHLDLLTAHKASRAISEKLELQDLVETMMRIVLESAGADRGLLLRSQNGAWEVVADATLAGKEIAVDSRGAFERESPPGRRDRVPYSIVRFAIRTQALVAADDPRSDPRFAQDPYIIAVKPRSTLCAPLLYQGKTIGVVYLENKLGRDVFNAERRNLLVLVAAQMATSLANADLYADLKVTVMEQKNTVVLLERRQDELIQTNLELASQRLQLSDQAKELQKLNATIVKASNSKSEFLANMSHELRTPLNSVLGFAELLYDGEVGPLAPKQLEFLGDILTSGKHLLQLINDVLDLSKVEAGKLAFHPEVVDLAAAIEEVRSVLRPGAMKKEILVATQLSPDVGAAVIDLGRFKQVLYNYLSNALKFTPNGGDITIRTLAEGPSAFRLEVEDTGVGIAAEEVERLFTDFHQVDASASKKHGGTGLGLALTKRLVEAQGGSVGAWSDPGKGSCFYAIFPIEGSSLMRPTDRDRLVRSLRRAHDHPDGSDCVIIVDDDPGSLKLASTVLVQLGCRTECFLDSAAALAATRRLRPRAIVLDLLMPKLDGFEFLRRLRASPVTADVPVCIWTMKDLSRTETERLLASAAGIVRKGAGSSELTAVLRRCLAEKTAGVSRVR